MGHNVRNKANSTNSSWFKDSFLKLAIVIFVVALISLAPTNHYLMLPGKVWNLSDIVSGGDYTGATSFHMTTISLAKANPLIFVVGKLVPSIEVVPRGSVIREGWTEKQHNFYSQYQMEQSHNDARMAMARQLGLAINEHSEGAYVFRVEPASSAEGVIREGDIIKALDGNSINQTKQLVEFIRQKNPGETVSFTIQRDDNLEVVETQLGKHAEQEGAYLGVWSVNHNWEITIPEANIKIDTGKVKGPSAGLMLTLEMINHLVPEDISHGKRIAGTGTITNEGTVGPIGGIVQKIRTAEKAGMDYFFLPRYNYDQVKNDINTDVHLIPVDSLGEALDYLYSLEVTLENYHSGGKIFSCLPLVSSGAS